ncbi:MAG: GTPase [Thermofilaceae archaeon]
MPANLPPQAKAKWVKVIEAKTKEEKLKALTEFLSAVPKHKGTEKLVMQIKRQISRLKEEIESEKSRKKVIGQSAFIEKEGDIQLILLGFPNSGKTTIFNALTGLSAPSSDAPFETRKPQPGMLKENGLEIQVVDTPSLVPSTDSVRNNQILALAFNADALALIIDASNKPNEQLSFMEKLLTEKGITVCEEQVKVTIEKRRNGGISVVGGKLRNDHVVKLLREYGVYHGLVKLTDEATLDDVETAILEAVAYRPALIILTKLDLDSSISSGILEPLKGIKVLYFKHNFRDLEYLKKDISDYLLMKLNLIRVYTRNPKTGQASTKPLVVRRGARVEDVARRIHSGLCENFKYAIVWNEHRLKFSPMKVGKDFELADLDIIEIAA